MEDCLINSDHHLAKYQNHPNLNLIKSVASKSEDRVLSSSSKFHSSSLNDSSRTNSSITRLMECQLCGNFSMDQEKFKHTFQKICLYPKLKQVF